MCHSYSYFINESHITRAKKCKFRLPVLVNLFLNVCFLAYKFNIEQIVIIVLCVPMLHVWLCKEMQRL